MASPLVEAVILLPGAVPSLFAKGRVARALPYAVCRPPETGDERKVSAHAFAAISVSGSLCDGLCNDTAHLWPLKARGS